MYGAIDFMVCNIYWYAICITTIIFVLGYKPNRKFLFRMIILSQYTV